ncbi:P-loop containing nucleoside triphosphate hydrolase protein [Gigaspora margarita]|uniref:P-loop containing nucleoside triphosphate hydrolase protein n=1 Tax=Gigaspora margarita TaxID=4874 RepID=A0A8H4AJA2_GIGMA|nr:P-loop containing nucleoside triphosphate hydrolase protein [Gigaspora margarita]
MVNMNYRIIDTVGIGDTSLSLRTVLVEIAKGCKKVKKGINQILFVCGERLTPEEIVAYDILRNILFDKQIDKDITKYTTIVRTKFYNFENDEECESDIKSLLEESNEAIVEVIESCNRRVVHLDIPPLNIKGEGKQNQININKKIRKEARKKLLNHLATCQDAYRSESLHKINKRIDDLLINENEKLKKQLETSQKKLEKLQEQLNNATKREERLLTEASEEATGSFQKQINKALRRLSLKERKETDELKRKMEELNKGIDEIRRKIENNERSIETSLFEAIGKRLDKLVELSTTLVGIAAFDVSKCQIL